MEKSELFEIIAKSRISGNLGLFVGAGFPLAVDSDENTIKPLSWKELLKKICFYEDINYDEIIAKKLVEKLKEEDIKLNDISSLIDYSDLPSIATEIKKIIAKDLNKSEDEAEQILKRRIAYLTNRFPSQSQKEKWSPLLKSLSPKWVVTTNYDLIIESIIPEDVISLDPSSVLYSKNNKTPVYHLHGITSNPNTIVITAEDYIKLNRPNDYRMNKLSFLFKESTTLMIGYSINDNNVKSAIDWSHNVFNDYQSEVGEKIIIFSYCANPKNEIIQKDNYYILETSNLFETLTELKSSIDSQVLNYEKDSHATKKLNKFLQNITDKKINDFIDNRFQIREIIYMRFRNYSENYNILANDFFERIFDSLQEKQHIYGNFEAYESNLSFTFDLLCNLDLKNISFELMSKIFHNLNSIVGNLGDNAGDAWYATGFWKKNYKNLPMDIKVVLKDMYKQNEAGSSYKWKEFLKD